MTYTLLKAAISLTMFLVPWWLRPEWMPTSPYVAGFLVTIPVAASIVLWALTGFVGLRQAWRDQRRWWMLFALLLVGWAVWSAAWSVSPTAAHSAALQLTVVLLFGLLVSCAGPRSRTVALALVAGLLFQGTISIAQVGLQRPLGLHTLGEFQIRPNNRGLSQLFAGDERLMRPYGLTVHPNVIGGYFMVALLAMTGWWGGAPRWWVLGLVGAMAAFGFWALLITFSRSAWLGFAAGLAFVGLTWLRPGARRPAPWHILIAGGVLLITAGAFVGTYSRFVLARAGVGGEVTELRSIVDRRVYTEVAFNLISRFPVTGVGIGNFPNRVNEVLLTTPYRELGPDFVHHMPLLIASELGVVGVSLWLALLAIGAGMIWNTTFDPFGVGVAAGAVSLVMIGMADKYPWTIMHFGLLLWGCLGAAMRPQQ